MPMRAWHVCVCVLCPDMSGVCLRALTANSHCSNRIISKMTSNSIFFPFWVFDKDAGAYEENLMEKLHVSVCGGWPATGPIGRLHQIIIMHIAIWLQPTANEMSNAMKSRAKNRKSEERNYNCSLRSKYFKSPRDDTEPIFISLSFTIIFHSLFEYWIEINSVRRTHGPFQICEFMHTINRIDRTVPEASEVSFCDRTYLIFSVFSMAMKCIN